MRPKYVRLLFPILVVALLAFEGITDAKASFKFLGNQFIANMGQYIWVSNNGLKWEGPANLGYQRLKDITYGNGLYYAMNTLASVLYSSHNCLKWNVIRFRERPPYGANRLVFHNSLVLAGYQSIWASNTNGTIWKGMGRLPTPFVHKPIVCGKYMYILSHGGVPTPGGFKNFGIIYSLLTNNKLSYFKYSGYGIRPSSGVCANNVLFLSPALPVLQKIKVLKYSGNGSKGHINPVNIPFSTDTIAYGNGHYIAYNTYGCDINHYDSISTNGNAWKAIKTNACMSSVAFGNGIFVGQSGMSLYHSLNGVHWSKAN
ncbi:hypothetical protein HER14_09960 [Acidithiobacillus thiooxidans]|uniref:hypothetical protein n=1 Tax=Acidithiobacillus thiooxidans TaxID=930 RepID=UPI001C07A00F|nr:hypothetical protein [Acidithiobacillus thiooxidans]MBU2751251.1 hypothetical protein [Acidithiobacillus thiooxidans]